MFVVYTYTILLLLNSNIYSLIKHIIHCSSYYVTKCYVIYLSIFMLSLCGNCECVSSSQLQGELKTPFTHTFTLKLVERTIKVLDIFDITEGKLKVIIRGKVVSWIHDSSRVRGVVQAKSMTKFMDCYSKQVESWKTVHHFSILQRKT